MFSSSVNRTTFIRTSTVYTVVGLLAVGLLGGCFNPAKETYEKGVEGGERAIDRANDVQNQIDSSAQQNRAQEKSLEGSSP